MTPSDLPVASILARASGPRREEADHLLTLHTEVSGEPAVVWAGRILGFGTYRYRYASGRSGTAPVLAFAPGPRHHTLYLSAGFADRWPELLAQLGEHRASTACLYLPRLTDVDTTVLRELLVRTRDEAVGSV